MGRRSQGTDLQETYSRRTPGGQAGPDAEYVVEGYREKALGDRGWRNCNLRTQFERIIKRAGLTPWPRIFHTLRSSRETELAAEYPIQVVTAWLGNTPRIALKHYLQVTDSDFTRAAAGPFERASSNGQTYATGAAESAAPSSKALRNPVQQGDEKRRNESPLKNETLDGARVSASPCAALRRGAKTTKRRGQDSNLRTRLPRSPI